MYSAHDTSVVNNDITVIKYQTCLILWYVQLDILTSTEE